MVKVHGCAATVKARKQQVPSRNEFAYFDLLGQEVFLWQFIQKKETKEQPH